MLAPCYASAGLTRTQNWVSINKQNLQINELFLFAFTLLNNTFIIKNFVQRNVLFIKQTIEIVRSQIFIFPKHDEHYEHKHF